MKIVILALAAAAPLLLAPMAPLPAAPAPAPAAAKSMCKAGEAVIFECVAGAKRIAVCGSEYRFGTAAKTDLSVKSGLTYAMTGYSGGGESQISVPNGDYTYIVYSSMIRTGFGKGGNKPKFESGVAVQKNGETVSMRKCTAPADASVDLALAKKNLSEGEFADR